MQEDGDDFEDELMEIERASDDEEEYPKVQAKIRERGKLLMSWMPMIWKKQKEWFKNLAKKEETRLKKSIYELRKRKQSSLTICLMMRWISKECWEKSIKQTTQEHDAKLVAL